MKIWLINPFSDLPGEGAAEGRFCCLARMLAEQGHMVTWWTVDFHHRKKTTRAEVRAPVFAAEGADAKTALGSGTCEIVLLPVPSYQKNISLARLNSHRAYGREFLKMAQQRIQAEPSCAPDVIHMSVPPLDCIGPALELKKQLGCRLTVDVMDLWPETFTRLIPGGEQMRSIFGGLIFAPMFRRAQLAYREADGVSSVSQEYLDVVQQVAPQQDTHLCYVGGEMSQPTPRKSHPVRFIYVGAMSPTYDLVTVLEVARELKDEGLDFIIDFAGGGISEQALRDRVHALKLSDTVNFLGYLNQSELESALVASDVGLNAIMPGTFITMPHKLSDYLCAGLAVINSISGEAEQVLLESGAGLNYVPASVHSLAECIRRFVNEPILLSEAQSAAYALGLAKFDRKKSYRELTHWVCAE
ncbi:glycosyltransferase family 4 protein [Coraliomargarita sp. W4R53]